VVDSQLLLIILGLLQLDLIMKGYLAVSLAFLFCAIGNAQFMGASSNHYVKLTNVGVGCFVSGNQLFAGHNLIRNLTEAEMDELRAYQNAMTEFNQHLTQMLEEQQRQWQENFERMFGGFRRRIASTGRNESDDQESSNPIAIENPSTVRPKLRSQRPEMPSFCNETDETIHVFGDCVVKNNKLYIENKYARDLTPAEVDQLRQFDRNMSAYQAQLSQSFAQQFRNMFNLNRRGMFGGSSDSGEEHSSEVSTSTSTSTTTTEEPLTAPAQPQFCQRLN